MSKKAAKRAIADCPGCKQQLSADTDEPKVVLECPGCGASVVAESVPVIAASATARSEQEKPGALVDLSRIEEELRHHGAFISDLSGKVERFNRMIPDLVGETIANTMQGLHPEPSEATFQAWESCPHCKVLWDEVKAKLREEGKAVVETMPEEPEGPREKDQGEQGTKKEEPAEPTEPARVPGFEWLY